MSKRKPYTRPVTATWWLSNPWFKRYILREATSVMVLVFCMQLVFALIALGNGPDSWQVFLDWLTHPAVMLLNLLCFIAALIHTGSWFMLAPKTMDLWIKDKKVDDKLIAGGHYAAFAVLSLVVLVLIGGWL